MITALSTFLQSYMRQHALTLRDMESRSGVSRTVLHGLCSGKEIEPRLSTLVCIARAVDLPLGRVIELAGFDLGLSPDAP